MTRPRYLQAVQGQAPTGPTAVDHPVPAASVPFGPDHRGLDGVLELSERGRHSATELRVLLALVDRRDASIPELAELLGAPPADLRPAARQLARRGLLRSWHLARTEQTLFALTAAGLATTQELLTAAGQAITTAAADAPQAAVVALKPDARAPLATNGSRAQAIEAAL
jgi:DNA-binding MarR family transcriptional regulator